MGIKRKTTDGPWGFEYDGSVVMAGQVVGRVRPDGATHEEALANGRLIAASPELLEAVLAFRDAVRVVIKDDPDLWEKAMRISDQAIDKAMGFRKKL